MNKLKPCPFCGKQEGTLKPLKPEGLSRVECNHCGNLAGRSEQESINQWNKRQSPWISVEDRLPEECVMVLVSYGTLKEIAYFEFEDGKPSWHDRNSFGQPWIQSPRFWMQIPQDPEVQL